MLVSLKILNQKLCVFKELVSVFFSLRLLLGEFNIGHGGVSAVVEKKIVTVVCVQDLHSEFVGIEILKRFSKLFHEHQIFLLGLFVIVSLFLSHLCDLLNG